MSTLVHKNDKITSSSSISSTKEQQSIREENKQSKNNENSIKRNLKNVSNQQRKYSESKTEIDFDQENRLSQVIALYTKGLTQIEISQQLGINQSTVSRDFQRLREEAKKHIWKFIDEDLIFEYMRYIVANNEINKELWKIVQDKITSTKEKTNALSLLNHSSMKRIELLINGPEALKNVKKNISEIKELEEMENDPFLKLSDRLSRLPQLPKLGSFRRR
jgi:hypothetical protein